MAVIITPKIIGQVVTSDTTYSYLYEPLEISILGASSNYNIISIDLEVLGSDSGIRQDYINNYGRYEAIAGRDLSVDLMKLVKQYHEADVFKNGTVDDIIADEYWQVISKYIYNFKIYQSTQELGNDPNFQYPVGSEWVQLNGASPGGNWQISNGQAFIDYVPGNNNTGLYPSLYTAIPDIVIGYKYKVTVDVETLPLGYFLIEVGDLYGLQAQTYELRDIGETSFFIEATADASDTVSITPVHVGAPSNTSGIINSIKIVQVFDDKDVSKLPIVGTRDFQTFEGGVTLSNAFTEFEYYGITDSYLAAKWSNVPIFHTQLKSGGVNTTHETIPDKEFDFPKGLYWTFEDQYSSDRWDIPGDGTCFFRSDDTIKPGNIYTNVVDITPGVSHSLKIDIASLGDIGDVAVSVRVGTIDNYEAILSTVISTVGLTSTLIPAVEAGQNVFIRFKCYSVSNESALPLELNSVSLTTEWANNYKPTVSLVTNTGTCEALSALIWKSKLGGWCSWGFEIEEIRNNKNHLGNLQTGMFNSTGISEGNPYIRTNYTQIESSKSITLKSLSLSKNELLAVSGINDAVVVYYKSKDSDKLELMQADAAIPLLSLSNGGDFNVSLSSISRTIQNSR